MCIHQQENSGHQELLRISKSNFWSGVILTLVFGGYTAVSIYLGWIKHLEVGHPLGNGPNDTIIFLARATLLTGVIGAMGLFMAIYEYRFIKQIKNEHTKSFRSTKGL